MSLLLENDKMWILRHKDKKLYENDRELLEGCSLNKNSQKIMAVYMP